MEQIEEAFLDIKIFEETIMIRIKKILRMTKKLIAFLRVHKECFAWDTRNMLGIDLEVITRKLNVDLNLRPVK